VTSSSVESPSKSYFARQPPLFDVDSAFLLEVGAVFTCPSVEAVPSWLSSVSSVNSELMSREGPVGRSLYVVKLAVAGRCFLLAGSGDGEGEGELRESRDKVELAIVEADNENDNEERKQIRTSVRAQEPIPKECNRALQS